MMVRLWVINARTGHAPRPSDYHPSMTLEDACKACKAGSLGPLTHRWHYEARPVGLEPLYDVVSYMVGHPSPLVTLHYDLPMAAALAYATQERARDAAGAVENEWRTIVRAAR